MSNDDMPNGARATIREVIALVEGSRKDVLAEIEKLQTRLSAELHQLETELNGKLQTHTVEHQRERDWRSGLVRWAVTTILTAAGVMFSIVWSLTH